MKNQFKTLFSLLACIVLSLNIVITVNAKESDFTPYLSTIDNDVIILQDCTYTEDDAIIHERILFYPDKTNSEYYIMGTSKSGAGTFKAEKEYTFTTYTNKPKMTYYAQGYFKWNSETGDVSVSNAKGGHSNNLKDIKFSNEKTNKGVSQYGYIFNNFAYVNYSFTTTNIFGATKDFEVEIRVSENGNTL